MYLFITHAHFDHVGSAGHLKQKWPDLQIAASKASSDILQRASVVDLISKLNQIGAETLTEWHVQNVSKDHFIPFTIDLTIDTKKRILVSCDVTVESFQTPGHTRDFTSYWIPERQILIASEAVGCDDGMGGIQTEFLVDYDKYLSGLNQLMALDPKILCTGHHLVLTGSDVMDFFDQALESTKRFFDRVSNILIKANADIDMAVLKTKQMDWDKRPYPKQPEQAYLINTRQRIITIKKKLGL